MLMISAWWLVAAFFAGAFIGVMCLALVSANDPFKKGD